MKVIILIVSLLITVSSYAKDLQEHRVWNNKPISINLTVNEEKIISFPGEISIDVPEYIAEISRIQIRSDGTIYWTAGSEFKKQRIIVKSKFGRVYLIDVSAHEYATTKSITIIDEVIEQKYGKSSSRQNPVISSGKDNKSYDYVDLIRYAAQSMYAPKRLIKEISVNQFPVVKSPLPLYRGQKITVVPVAQWKTNSIPTMYVTALSAYNDTSELLEVDVRKIRGKYLARSSQHGALGAKGSKTDNTTIYLVSDKPFMEAIHE